MDEVWLQSSQEAVPGTSRCKYQDVLFLICLFIIIVNLRFCWGSEWPSRRVCTRSWKVKRYFKSYVPTGADPGFDEGGFG